MWKDKPTGIKILWLWTIGTATILLTCVSKNRINDMEKIMNQKQGISTVDSGVVDNSLPSDEKIITEHD
ncbi:unnamed protein product [Amaranthus hypochondriacus]